MNARLPILLAAVLILSGCGAIVKREKKEYTPSSELLCDSIIIHNADDNTGIAFNYNNNLQITCFSANDSFLYLYDVSANHLSDSIPVKRDFISKEYYIDNNKRLYTLNRETNCIYYLDPTGKEKTIYTKPDANEVSKHICAVVFPFKILPDSNLILFSIPQYHTAIDSERRLYYRSKILAHYKLTGDSLVKKHEFGQFPEFYQHNFYYEFFPVTCLTDENEVLYMFGNSNTLYTYNIKDGKTTQKLINGLKLNDMTPFDITKGTDLSFAHDYQVKVPGYVKLLHDELTGNTLVFQSLTPEKNHDEDKIQIYSDKPLLVNVADTSLTIQKKIYFTDQSNIFFNNSAYHNGYLYIQERAKGNNELKVYVYKIR